MMKGSHGAQASPHNKGLFLVGNWFIILCFRLRSCHGRRQCTHPPCYSSVCQNSTWWECRFPLEIPRVLVFDQSKPMTLLFCIPIWFGAFTYSQILPSPLAPGGVKGHELVSCRAHIWKTNLIFRFAHGLRNATERPARAWPLTFRRVVLPDDAGIGTTHRLAHEIDVAALVDRDILGHISDPGGNWGRGESKSRLIIGA